VSASAGSHRETGELVDLRCFAGILCEPCSRNQSPRKPPISVPNGLPPAMPQAGSRGPGRQGLGPESLQGEKFSGREVPRSRSAQIEKCPDRRVPKSQSVIGPPTQSHAVGSKNLDQCPAGRPCLRGSLPPRRPSGPRAVACTTPLSPRRFTACPRRSSSSATSPGKPGSSSSRCGIH